MTKSRNLTYEEAAMILLHRKYPGIFLSGGVLITGEVANIPQDDPRYVKGDVKAKYVQPERRKLNIPSELKQALESIVANKPVSYIPPSAPEAPPFIPIAPPLAMHIPQVSQSMQMPREARIYDESQMYQPLARRNILEELKDYKDGLEYVRNICPLLKRTYIKKEIKPKPSKKILNALERMKKADLKYKGFGYIGGIEDIDLVTGKPFDREKHNKEMAAIVHKTYNNRIKNLENRYNRGLINENEFNRRGSKIDDMYSSNLRSFGVG